ncbi:hypothetical protein [Streptomyces sp. TRM68367]|uniref:hypothetical protein n=1 Tax=Streptomyces sp. TRM68367 TaxID=2758415 RepID=UPI00165A6630|nr:hypothetical protein [Streptomyces sp. TRM68367]MBC9725937.1 hypothetical protein [Streptomyces sp. TRM68367]
MRMQTLRRLARTRTAIVLAVLCVLTEALTLAIWIPADIVSGEPDRDPQQGAAVAILLSAVVSR